jgi:hypothetical protein
MQGRRGQHLLALDLPPRNPEHSIDLQRPSLNIMPLNHDAPRNNYDDGMLDDPELNQHGTNVASIIARVSRARREGMGE